MRVKYRVDLTEAEGAPLSGLIGKGTHGARTPARTRILFRPADCPAPTVVIPPKPPSADASMVASSNVTQAISPSAGGARSAMRAASFIARLSMLSAMCVVWADQAIAQTGVHCGNDLMRVHRIRIPHAKLYRSEDPAGPSQLMCRSVYKIPGKYAHAAESILIGKYGMGKLGFECCGWFPLNGKQGVFRRSHPMASGAYASYSIYMTSEETTERKWGRIETFYLTLDIHAI